MNILLINHYAGSPEYGMEFRPYYMCKEWLKLGHKVLIVGGSQSHLRKQQPLKEHETIDGVDYSWVKLYKYKGNGVGRIISMGMFISKLGMKIDIPKGKLSFRPSTEGMNRILSRMGMGYISMEMVVAGKSASVILDTGAPTSYVSKTFTEGLTPIGQVTDFNPLVPGDTFETPIFEFPASFAGKEFTMKAGNLPSSLQIMLSFIGVDGVIGMEILKRFSITIAEGSIWV